jgi:hypothetical protein
MKDRLPGGELLHGAQSPQIGERDRVKPPANRDRPNRTILARMTGGQFD